MLLSCTHQRRIGCHGTTALPWYCEDQLLEVAVSPLSAHNCCMCHHGTTRRYCEDQLLEVAVRYGLCQPPSARLPLEDMLASHLAKVGTTLCVLYGFKNWSACVWPLHCRWGDVLASHLAKVGATVGWVLCWVPVVASWSPLLVALNCRWRTCWPRTSPRLVPPCSTLCWVSVLQVCMLESLVVASQLPLGGHAGLASGQGWWPWGAGTSHCEGRLVFRAFRLMAGWRSCSRPTQAHTTVLFHPAHTQRHCRRCQSAAAWRRARQQTCCGAIWLWCRSPAASCCGVWVTQPTTSS